MRGPSMRRAPNLKPLSRRRTILAGAAIGLGIALALAGARRTSTVEGVEWQFVDARTRSFADDSDVDPRIVLAVVTEDDVSALRADPFRVEWPWPLVVNALAFQWMAACGVAGVVVDVYHLDQGAGEGEWTNSPALAAEAEVLAGQYRAIGNVTLAFELTSGSGRARRPPLREPLRIAPMREKLAAPPPLPVPSYERPYARLPVATLLRGAHRLGFANMDTDADGIARRTTPVGRVVHLDPGGPSQPLPGQSAPPPDAPATEDRAVVPSLGLAAAIGLAREAHVSEDLVVLDGVAQRLDARRSFYVNFRGPSGTYPTVSPAALAIEGSKLEADPNHPGPDSGPVSRAALKGKIVVWGIHLPGNEDAVTTSVSQGFLGPEFQATILDNLLHGDGRVSLGSTGNLAVLLGLCAGLGAVGGAWSRRGVFVGSALLAAVGVVLASYLLFARGTVIDLFTPLAGIVLTYAGVVAFRLMTEGRRNRWLESTFGQYLSPAVIEQLKKDPTRLALGGRRTQVTVLFSDIKGFTSISEQLKDRPTEFQRLMNVYLTGQSEPVLAEDGTIDKFIGDAVMAFFGDPLEIGDHALRACRAAIRSQEALAPLQPLAASLGLPPLVNRIGVNTGPAYVGNMGSEKRFSYTAMGDDVNLASRLEGANKAFGTHVLVGPQTYEQARDGIVAKPIGRLRVVGKTEPVMVHELVALRQEASEETRRHAEAYGRAHAAALSDDLDAALRHLDEAESLRPGDGASAWLRTFVEGLRRGDAPRPWDGVVVLESKG